MEDKAIKLFKSKIKEKIVNIEDSSKGVNQIVNIITTEKSKYVVKYAQDPIHIIREVLACEKLKDKIPVPITIFHNKHCLIQTYIEGTDFDSAKLTKKERYNLYKELGSIVKKMHRVKLKGYGDIEKDKIGGFKSYSKYIKYNLDEHLPIIQKYITKKEYETLLAYLENTRKYQNTKKRSLLHQDLEEGNMKVQNKKVSGIIDFGDLSVGPAVTDFARPYCVHYSDGLFDAIKEGYKTLDVKEVKFQAIMFLIWNIPHQSRKTNKKRFNKYKKIFRNIINQK
jgi:aminoglycoside phosphotransferase (APT) family kinase protein